MSGEYPTEDELKKVTEWEFKKPGDFKAFMDYVQSIGKYWPEPDLFGWRVKGRNYGIASGGWSGNEEIISAMQDNLIFWTLCWQGSERGGHYKFELPDEAVYFKAS